jgi:hypothetical protein
MSILGMAEKTTKPTKEDHLVAKFDWNALKERLFSRRGPEGAEKRQKCRCTENHEKPPAKAPCKNRFRGLGVIQTK